MITVRILKLLRLATIPTMASAACGAAEPATAAPAGGKPYTLYLGAEVSVQQAGQFHRVRDVSDAAFVVLADDKKIEVPMGRTAVNLKIDPVLKLSDRAATVAGLKSERCYTPQNDPWKKFQREQPGASGSAMIATAEGNYNVAMAAVASAAVGSGDRSSLTSSAAASAMANAAVSGIDRAAFAAGADMNNTGKHVGRLMAELDKEEFDAIEVTFDVSAERPLAHPYVVLVATFRAAGARPDAVQNWIYAKALKRIDAKPTKVHVKQGGFPPGFELKGCAVHLYDDGNEVATNIASKRVPLSRDEAFQYVMMDHLGSHRGATVPAVTTLTDLSPQLREELARGRFAATVYVKVGANGRAAAIFSDANCARRLEGDCIRQLADELRFKPALEKGKPVDCVFPLSLERLAQL